MYKEEVSLFHTVMGEAVMLLLNENSPVTCDQLLLKLHAFLPFANEAARSNAIHAAVRSVQVAILQDACRIPSQDISCLH
ncbi:hypothetical protein ACNY68_20825 [Pantoea sp. KXB25]|uniref:hypothetical protein n=1 Tax=unclassified Pantoea TaxID=2630326 RepID=UPI003AB1D272